MNVLALVATVLPIVPLFKEETMDALSLLTSEAGVGTTSQLCRLTDSAILHPAH
jgi:hypothetical protein